MEPLSIDRWSVSFGDGRPPQPIYVPHSWRQDLPLADEGPVTYRASVEVPRGQWKLRFVGVSYAATVFVNGEPRVEHLGIWDAFDVPLPDCSAKTVEIEVQVTKNGGEAYPVDGVASGRLPSIFHSFGGIFREVLLLPTEEELQPVAAPSRVEISGDRILVDGESRFLRAVVHPGWYPEVGHPSPSAEASRDEILLVQSLGFDVIKFNQWLPTHKYLEAMNRLGVFAWIELPVADPGLDPRGPDAAYEEIERIVKQYRRHDHIIAWSIPSSVPDSEVDAMQKLVGSLSGCPLIAGLSAVQIEGWAEPYDWLPIVSAASLVDPGAKPMLISAFGEVGTHRDIARIGDELPFWASSLPELNQRGVRAKFDIQEVVAESRFSLHPSKNDHQALMEATRQKALFLRKLMHEGLRSSGVFAGYAACELRDNPIATSGFVDDWGEPRFTAAECRQWNGPQCLTLHNTQTLRTESGHLRAIWEDPLNKFAGTCRWELVLHTESRVVGALSWRLVASDGVMVARGALSRVECPALKATRVGVFEVPDLAPGSYRLICEFAGVHNEWPVWVVEPEFVLKGWRVDDPAGVLSGLVGSEGGRVVCCDWRESSPWDLLFLSTAGTVAGSFWRDTAFEFLNDSFWAEVPLAEQWERLLPVSTNRMIDPAWLEAQGEHEVLLRRIDTHTYQEHAVVARVGARLVTTLRPWGGLGSQPHGLVENPAGVGLLTALTRVSML